MLTITNLFKAPSLRIDPESERLNENHRSTGFKKTGKKLREPADRGGMGTAFIKKWGREESIQLLN